MGARFVDRGGRRSRFVPAVPAITSTSGVAKSGEVNAVLSSARGAGSCWFNRGEA